MQMTRIYVGFIIHMLLLFTLSLGRAVDMMHFEAQMKLHIVSCFQICTSVSLQVGRHTVVIDLQHTLDHQTSVSEGGGGGGGAVLPEQLAATPAMIP